ncbi:unnamed protein product [Gulo gulo]|uniref:Uncharacterized protein n=1 Tax=Gulo gulo TaxID=48420 RepID=A0A9X9LZC0_GULGU|nr:unnamed protein product [Gulo gulo]
MWMGFEPGLRRRV